MPSTRARTSAVRTACSRPGSSITLAIGCAVDRDDADFGGRRGGGGGADLEQAARSSAAPKRRAWSEMIIGGE